jgi:phenylpropionate dioxygenase-like ring-hydroxylating dioxygenase large terminal subunit
MNATSTPRGTPTSTRNAFYTEDLTAGTFRLHPKVYTDPTILEREMREVFGRSWLYVGHESEVPTKGSFITRRVGGRPIILVRGDDGNIRLMINVCRHRGNVICRERKGTARSFLCSYHSWNYNNRGKLVGVSRKEAYAPGFDAEELGLLRVRMESYRGLIFLCFSERTEGLVEYLAGAREILDLILDSSDDEGGTAIVGGSHDYGVDANWKLLMDNTMDIYHVFSTHNRYVAEFLPSVMNVRPTPSQMFDSSRAMDLGNGHVNIEVATFGTPSIDADKLAGWQSQYGAARANQMLNFRQQLLLFPNTLFLQTWQAIRTCQPVTHNRMEVTAWALMPVKDDPKAREMRLAMYNSFLGPGGFATPDDVEVMETLQANMSSTPELDFVDMSRGMAREQPLCDDELQMRGFWKHWYKRVGAGIEAEAAR